LSHLARTFTLLPRQTRTPLLFERYSDRSQSPVFFFTIPRPKELFWGMGLSLLRFPPPPVIPPPQVLSLPFSLQPSSLIAGTACFSRGPKGLRGFDSHPLQLIFGRGVFLLCFSLLFPTSSQFHSLCPFQQGRAIPSNSFLSQRFLPEGSVGICFFPSLIPSVLIIGCDMFPKDRHRLFAFSRRGAYFPFSRRAFRYHPSLLSLSGRFSHHPVP